MSENDFDKYVDQSFEHSANTDIFDEPTELVVKKTNNYAKFLKIPGNRTIKNHWIKIRNSMLEKQIPVPVIVNPDHAVIDGGHRIEACIDANLPIYYLVIPELNLEDVIRLNHDQVRWGNQDYVNSHVVMRKPAFLTIKKFQDDYSNLGLWHVCAILTETYRRVGGADFKEDIERGTFEVTADLDIAGSIAASLNMSVGKFKRKRASKDDVNFGMLKLISIDKFNVDIFFEDMNDLEKLSRKLKSMDGSSNILDQLRREWNKIAVEHTDLERISTADLA